ncbi:MAG: FAD-dependent oxidoreductase [Nocardioides sp.]
MSPVVSPADSPAVGRPPRTVVVGAGLAGLTAAAELAAGGSEVVVLEARDRVGGRLLGVEVAPGEWVDAGAAYLGDKHTELLDLMTRLGLKPAPMEMVGDSRFVLAPAGSEAATRAGRFPPLSAVALGDLFEQLDALTRQIDPIAPWRTPDAARLDRLTAARWAEEQLPREDARLFFPLFLG